MKSFTIAALLFLFSIPVATAHEIPAPVSDTDASTVISWEMRHASEAADRLFHLVVFGGLGLAGLNGLRHNKRATGKYFAWYRG